MGEEIQTQQTQEKPIETHPEIVKKKRGRPLGSKNKKKESA